jgi:hypothetical protein
LLDNSAAEIRVDQAAVGALDRLFQTGVVDALTPGAPNQPFGFEDAHAMFLRYPTIAHRAIVCKRCRAPHPDIRFRPYRPSLALLLPCALGA